MTFESTCSLNDDIPTPLKFGYFFFVLLGAWMIFFPHHFDWNNGWRYSKLGTQLIGTLCFSYMIFIGLVFVWKYLNRTRITLRINEHGIWANELSNEVIPWNEIKRVEHDETTVILHLTSHQTSKVDRVKMLANQNNAWSDVNKARLSLLLYTHSSEEIWSKMNDAFNFYNETKTW